MALLQVEQLHLGNLPPISFQVEPGTALVLSSGEAALGSLVLRCCVGLSQPEGGEIRVHDRPIDQWPWVDLRRRLVRVAGTPDLLGMTVAETIAYPLVLQGLGRSLIQERLKDCCQTWGIREECWDDRDHTLSPNDRLKVTLARAWILQPELLLLDLPPTLLDHGPGFSLMAQIDRLLAEKPAGLLLTTPPRKQPLPIQHLSLTTLILRQSQTVDNPLAPGTPTPELDCDLESPDDDW